MFELSKTFAVCFVLVASKGFSSYVEAATSTGSSGETPAVHFEPQVAMLCPEMNEGQSQAYHSQYMSESGHWLTDLDNKATCLKDKLQILEYCKKVYPKRDITNIVEASHYQKVANWCKVGHKKCKASHAEKVKPYRCLEGPFQSDALLVPENCLFDHIHNETKCWQFERWNVTAAHACTERDLALRSFAMLLPCGISLFAGVEFVCCPKHFKESMKPKKPIDVSVLGKDLEVFDSVDDIAAADDADDADEDDVEDEMEDKLADDPAQDEDDEYDDDDSDAADTDADLDDIGSSTPSTSTAATSTPSFGSSVEPAPGRVTPFPTPDPYFTHFDPRVEHQAYKDAQQRLEEMHREKVTKVMKDWSDLEERYQDMRATDGKAAEEFKGRMTQRFQKTVQALEEEGDAEKRQLVAMHQQRVMAHINERKKEAMACYTQALNENQPNTHRVQKCLQKLLRSLHKDRHHTISHYRHLLVSSFEQAEREKSLTLEHLIDIDKTVNQSMQMLDRFPDLRGKIGQLMEDYIQALRSKDETPGSLLSMTRDAEAAILDKFRADVALKQEEKERQRALEKQRKEQRKKERFELREEKQRVEASLGNRTPFDPETMEDERAPSTAAAEAARPRKEETARASHAQAHDVSHGEPSYSVRREVYHRETKSVYFTLAFAGIALMAAVIVGVAVLRRRSARSPHSQGFVEVDQAATPEERHVANMQINGYENPTYKYFEVKE